MTDPVTKPYRILAIDDSQSLLDGIKLSLDFAGFETLTAESGEEALDLIREVGLPNLALVDINMPPGMDGLEFCEIVHEFSDLPVIMLTAVEEEETIIHAIENHAEDYITKPFNLKELLVRVNRVLSRLGGFACTLDPSEMVDQHLSVSFPDCQVIVSIICVVPCFYEY